VVARMSRWRKDSSFKSREMRASAFKCAPAESSRRHQQEEEVRRLAVERAEVDAAGLRPKAAINTPQARELTVRMATPSPSADHVGMRNHDALGGPGRTGCKTECGPRRPEYSVIEGQAGEGLDIGPEERSIQGAPDAGAAVHPNDPRRARPFRLR